MVPSIIPFNVIIHLILVNDENDSINCTTTEETDEMLDKENEVPPAKKRKRTKTSGINEMFIITALLNISI